MRKELQDIELIESYLREELSDEALDAFKDRLKNNVSFQNEVNLQKDLLLAIERIGIKQDIQKAQKRYFNSYKGWYLIISFILITSLALSYYFSISNPEYTPKEFLKIEAVLDSTLEITSPIEVLIDSATGKKEEVEIKKIIPTAQVENEKLILPTKEYQYFNIDQTRDTLLKGAEGTIIILKANSFSSNSKELTIRLKEYYRLSDIAFSNLTTQTTDDEIIETGGMIYLDALSKTGARLELRPEKRITIRFPFKEKKPDMKLFTGAMNEDDLLEWEEAQVPQVLEESSVVESRTKRNSENTTIMNELFTIVEDMPAYPSCLNSSNKKELDECTQLETQNFIRKNIKYTTDAIAAKAKGTAYIRYQIDEHGFVSNVKLVRGFFPSLDNQAIAVVKSLPRHVPGKQIGKPVAVQFTIPIKFNYKESDPLKSYTPREVKATNDSILKLRKAEKEAFLENRLGFIEKIIDNEEEIDFEMLSTDIEYYVLSSSDLGWINCDRFIRDGRETINYALSDIPENSRVRIIFHQSKSIIAGKWNNGNYEFQKLPKGEKITVFVLKRQEGQSYICFQETEISKNIPALEFKQVKSEDIKVYAKRMNELP